MVSDQPIMEEEGFLPMSTVIQRPELLSPDTMQGTTVLLFDHDEEEQQTDRDQSVTTEVDLGDLGLEDLVEEKNETFSNGLEDYGSGSQEEKEGSEKEKEVLSQIVLAQTKTETDLQPRASEEKKKSKNKSDLKLRNVSQFEDVGEDGKKTWYFWK